MIFGRTVHRIDGRRCTRSQVDLWYKYCFSPSSASRLYAVESTYLNIYTDKQTDKLVEPQCQVPGYPR